MANDDWQEVVIETGVDTLLDYLAEEGETPVSEISDDLGVSEDRIKDWAKALEDNDFVEISYSARKGMKLNYTKQNKDVADEKLEQVRQEVEETTEKVQEEMEDRSDEIEQAKKKLKQMTEELEENREEENRIKQNLEELEELEEELEEKLSSQKQKQQELHSKSVNLISRIDNTLNRIEEAEDKAEEFDEKEHEIKKKIKALKKLENHVENVDDLERELEDLKEKEQKASNIFQSFKEKIESLFGPGADDEELLAGSVDEIKKELEQREDVDYQELLEREKKGKDRKTLEEFLEGKIEDE